jgi:hypothetical protein
MKITKIIFSDIDLTNKITGNSGRKFIDEDQKYQKANQKPPSPNLLKVSLILILVIGLVGSMFLLMKNKNINKYKGDCVNYQDKQFFKRPIPIVWTARFGGCLRSCWGAYFTRVSEDDKYPQFSGYVPDDGDRIADEFMKEGQILKIYGKWTDVSNSYGFIFDNKCVPTVVITKIEIIK